MYIHLGRDVVIRSEQIVGIFDLDNCSVSKGTKTFLKLAEKKGRLLSVSDELPKSFIVTSDGKKQVAYLSQISAATLLKRADVIENRNTPMFINKENGGKTIKTELKK